MGAPMHPPAVVWMRPLRLRWLTHMPDLSRFYGIVIRMFVEVGTPHHRPHFHAYCQDAVGKFGLDPIELISGYLPKRQRRLVEA